MRRIIQKNNNIMAPQKRYVFLEDQILVDIQNKKYLFINRHIDMVDLYGKISTRYEVYVEEVANNFKFTQNENRVIHEDKNFKMNITDINLFLKNYKNKYYYFVDKVDNKGGSINMVISKTNDEFRDIVSSININSNYGITKVSGVSSTNDIVRFQMYTTYPFLNEMIFKSLRKQVFDFYTDLGLYDYNNSSDLQGSELSILSDVLQKIDTVKNDITKNKNNLSSFIIEDDYIDININEKPFIENYLITESNINDKKLLKIGNVLELSINKDEVYITSSVDDRNVKGTFYKRYYVNNKLLLKSIFTLINKVILFSNMQLNHLELLRIKNFLNINLADSIVRLKDKNNVQSIIEVTHKNFRNLNIKKNKSKFVTNDTIKYRQNIINNYSTTSRINK